MAWPVGAAALVLASAAGGGSAAFPAPAGRILVNAEEPFAGFALTLVDLEGRTIGVGGGLGARGGASFSPDGRSLAISAVPPFPGGGRSDAEIGVGPLVAGGFRSTSNGSAEERPAWAADGSRVVFASDRDGDWDIYEAPVAALASARNLTADSPAAERSPRLSPDGRLLAFESDRDGDVEIYVGAADGSGAANFTRNPADDTAPDWSPDSSRIVFSSTRTGRGDVYALPAGVGEATRLTANPWPDEAPLWSPDGRWIAFSTERDGDGEVFVVAPDGTGERRLTDNATEDAALDWQPLFDTVPPVARALPGRGRHGRPIVLRFRASDDRRIGAVVVSFEYRVRNGGGFGSISLDARSLRSLRSGSGYAYRLDRRALQGSRPPSLRFCVEVLDEYANIGRHCATYRFVTPRTRRGR
jgi:hypothetical protein